MECTEDMACWDCHTMGNQICGTLVPDTATPAPESGGIGEMLVPALVAIILIATFVHEWAFKQR